MDRGENPRDVGSGADAFEGVAEGASSRVGEILAEAERRGRQEIEAADRDVAAIEQSARTDVERLFEDARAEARRVARERADHLAAIQAKLAARGPAVLEGLEGAGAIRARLEALIEALGAAADRVVAEAEAGEPRGASEAEAHAGAEPADADSPAEPEPDEDDAIPDAVVVEDPVEDADAAASSAAEEVAGTEDVVSAPAEDGGDGVSDAEPVALASGSDANGSEANGDEPSPFDGTLPDGAPMARKPERSRDRDARFSALLLALQGRDRVAVEKHLRVEYELDDCVSILDEVFGRADARA
jgi:hypothetical protein